MRHINIRRQHMGIRATLHPFLNNGTELQLDLEGRTVGECIKTALKQYPAMGDKMFAKNGKLKGYVVVLVNGKDAAPNELDYPVNDGDAMSVLIMLSGG
jgi:molybdopterin converting factor small subunit